MSRYGRDWAISCMENANGHVSPRVLAKCKLETPAKDWVDLYLYEISKAYQINWRPEGAISATQPGETEPDTAAQEQRLVEAELAPSGSDSHTKADEGDDENGDLASKLPSAPSSQPHLTNVKNSTTSIPIIKPEERNSSSTAPHKPGEMFDLPTTPPVDPSQSSRTVIIKSNLGQSPNNSATPAASSPGQDKKAETTYEVSKRDE